MGSQSNVDAAISSAAAAFPQWAALGAQGRLPYLQRFAEEIGKRKDALCDVESTDAGILLSRLATRHHSTFDAEHYLVCRSST